MTAKELLEQDKERYERRRKILSTVPENITGIKFVTSDTIFMDSLFTIEDVLEKLKILSMDFGKWKCVHYYMCNDKLGISYKFENLNFDINFSIVEYEKALEKISSGTCRIEKTLKNTVEYNVVCEV